MNAHQRVRFVGPQGKLLTEIAFDPRPDGLPSLAFFNQPDLERGLRREVSALPSVEVAEGWTLDDFAIEGTGVRATIRETEGAATRAIRARYLLGCDGAQSGVRRHIGGAFVGSTFAQRWLVVDLRTDRPIAHLPYYTAHCDPVRPWVNMPCPGGHRFEFMLLPGESADEMTKDEVVRGLVGAQCDLTSVSISRAVVYTFHARVADRWRSGPVFLLGDAAHAMPPFAGQGLASGLRDAFNLGWKLASVVQGTSAERLLNTYEAERRPHVEAMIRLNLLMSRIIQSRSKAVAVARDSVLRGISAAPVLGAWFQRGGIKPAPALPAASLPRLVPRSGARGGALVTRPHVRTAAGRVVTLDDVLGDHYALVGIGVDPCRHLDSPARAFWDSVGVEYLTVVPYGGRPTSKRPAATRGAMYEDMDGLLTKQFGRAVIAVIRPDRFVLGVFRTDELAAGTATFARLVGPSVVPSAAPRNAEPNVRGVTASVVTRRAG